MNLLARVRDQLNSMNGKPKAVSHNPDLAGREHVYRQGYNQVVMALDNYADYARVYEAYTWAHKAIRLVAENLAGLPVRVVDGSDKELLAHPISELLAYVNDEQTPIDLWGMYTVSMMLAGEAPYELVPDKGGRPVEIWLRRPDRVAVVPDATRLEYPTAAGYIFEVEEVPTQPIAIDAPWMIFDKFYNPTNPWRGLAPIHAVREGITIDMFAQAWSKGFLKNNTRPDFAIIAPQGITKSERDDYEARFIVKHRGAENAHLPVILEQGVTDIKTLSFPPKDIEWLQQREFARDEVGAIFGVPDELMGFGKDTYENFQTALTVFWTLTMMPLIRRRDTVLTHHFQRYGWLRPTERVATDYSDVGVLREDLTPKIDQAVKLWAMGVPFNTLDESLGLGIGRVAGGEIGYLSSSVKTVEQITNPPEPPPMLAPTGNNAPPPDEQSEDDEPEPQARYILPEGAKEQAARVLKKLIQQYQDANLRALRANEHCTFTADLGELRRWLGDNADEVRCAIEDAIADMPSGHDDANAAFNALKTDASIRKLLEVEASTPFFTLAYGAITPNIYKQLVLQLDPDDDEAERAIREGIERRFERELHNAFQEQLGDLLPDDASDDTIRAAPSNVAATSEPVREVLRRELEQSSSLGVSVALDTLESIGFGFDWTLAHADAARWASQYSYELIRGINSTTQARMQQAVTDWFQERTTLRDLVRELEPTFGRKRAKLIALTETTRAAREGSTLGYENSGVVKEVEWATVVDERVCPICGGLHGKRAPLRGAFPNGASQPPAHPGCRCFIRPVITE